MQSRGSSMEDVAQEELQRTQTELGKVIKRPILSDKLLKRPPFKFLHDIIVNVSRFSCCWSPCRATHPRASRSPAPMPSLSGCRCRQVVLATNASLKPLFPFFFPGNKIDGIHEGRLRP